MPSLRYQAVIFDLYGTLIDFSARALDQTIEDIAAILGLSHGAYISTNADKRASWEEGAYATLEAHFEDVCSTLGASNTADRVQAAVARCLAFGRSGLVPRPGAVATLTRLRASGYRVGLISNCSNEVPILWPECSLAPLVDVSVFSCEERVRKPDPRIYRIACDRLGVAPEACVYVGDGGSNELSGAAAVGMCAVQICVPDEDLYDIERLGREVWSGRRITRLSEVCDLLAVARYRTLE